jgi:hypothetical protein
MQRERLTITRSGLSFAERSSFISLNASKLIMRPERVAEEQLDPCPCKAKINLDDVELTV